MKVNLHPKKNCSVNNMLVFAAVKQALRKQPEFTANIALGFLS